MKISLLTCQVFVRWHLQPRRYISFDIKTSKSMSQKLLPNIIRLTNVPGFELRRNDVVYCRPSKMVENPGIVVFFGGDVQDFTENMLSHRDNKNHVEWNLENTAKLLQSSFVDKHIVVIRPVRMEYKTFSCYENFLPCSKCGVPEHQSIYNGLHHLEMILDNLSTRLQTMTNEEFIEAVEIANNGLVPGTNLPAIAKTPEDVPLRNTIEFNNCDITIIGFSKGCVVLNQFLYEFHHYQNSSDDDKLSIVPRIKDMYWLDGGHSGGKNTWVTYVPLLETVASMGINVHVHVSPYQVADERRPWIKKEEKYFSETLKTLGVDVNRIVHFTNVPSSLQTHFNVLTVFKEGAADSSD